MPSPDPAPAPIRRFHPNRVEYVLPAPILPGGCWTEDRPGATTGHPGVDALLAVPGVAILTLRDDRIRIVRDPAVAWEPILAAVQEILVRHFLPEPEPFRPPAAPDPASAQPA